MKWKIIGILVILAVLARLGCSHQDDLETKLVIGESKSAVYRDSINTLYDSLEVVKTIDSAIIGEKEKEIVKLSSDLNKWKRQYLNLQYKHKILLLEQNIGDVQVEGGLTCLNEHQVDSVNIIAKDRENCLERELIAFNVIQGHKRIIATQETQKDLLGLQIDTLQTENDSLLYANAVLYNKTIKKEKKIRRNRKGWIWTAVIAVFEGWLLTK